MKKKTSIFTVFLTILVLFSVGYHLYLEAKHQALISVKKNFPIRLEIKLEEIETFLKSTARRIVGPDEPVGIRTDSNWQIPEPELALVIREDGEIVGYTIGNDMSSRDIEGENPLYLPQAKMWKNSCSIGPAILLADTVTDPYDLNIECRIKRDGQWVFKGSANTSMLKRRYEELVDFLLHDNDIVSGTTLLTGTCIVPDDSFTLEEGDEIEIEIDQIGILRNPVKMANHIE